MNTNDEYQQNVDQWSYVDFGTRRTTACHRECHKPCSSRARVSERIGHPRDAMGSQLISCTGLLLARIHEITAADTHARSPTRDFPTASNPTLNRSFHGRTFTNIGVFCQRENGALILRKWLGRNFLLVVLC